MIINIKDVNEVIIDEILEKSLENIISILNTHTKEESIVLFVAITSAVIYEYPKDFQKPNLDILCRAALDVIDKKDKGLI